MKGVAYSGTTVIFSSAAALMLGVIVGVGTMLLFAPTPPETKADAPSETRACPEPEAASGTASASAPPPRPGVDPKVIEAQRKLAKLREIVKSTRARQIDAECAKYFKKKYPAGYVYSGGKFEQNEYVANAAGCVAVAKPAKAPWFCCAK